MDKDYYRIHHIRPRFKNDVEGVLYFIANSICQIGELPKEEFKNKLNAAIRFYPGNLNATDKTINNWRTEISALFCLIVTKDQNTYPSDLAHQLNKTGNLIQFFQNFLFYFQYPGGHLKPHEVVNMLNQGIKFKPVQYLLNLFVYGTTLNNGIRFGLLKEEATHLIFNNLNVTRDGINPDALYEKILENRSKHIRYDTSGDVIRYAGDILDYMVLADLLDRKLDGKYYPRMQNLDIINAFKSDENYFQPYDPLYGKTDLQSTEVRKYETQWQLYSSQSIQTVHSYETYQELLSKKKTIQTDISERQKKENEKSVELAEDIIERIINILSNDSTTKQIGDLGEAVTIKHEINRMIAAGRPDLINKIKKIPEMYAAGYDIRSFLGINDDFKHIHIEVKSTISKNKLRTFTFSLTPNEFEAAKSHLHLYFIYRIFISTESIKMFVIRDPIGELKKDNLSLSIVSKGAQITFTEHAGNWKKLLI